ncbi:PEP-CTERM sorting domain-containing protein [Rhizobacter sp. LjRoot28]|uniref:PEP-CTERM sorting domain-containing protein n=1 Tax=Rhizobacter sp. LjRoot28 TaxID=3342309 RepID=UPI003ECEFF46
MTTPSLRSLTARLLPAVLLISALAATAAPITTIDQANPGPFTGTGGNIAPNSYGQSFTAGLSAVDAFDFLLGGFEANVVVRVRDGLAGFDGLSGNILAESAPVLVDKAGSFWFHFDLNERLALNPGQTYVAELAILTGSLGIRITTDNSYAGGELLITNFAAGELRSDYDMVFQEGLHSPVPEPASALLMMLGFAGIGWGVRRRVG